MLLLSNVCSLGDVLHLIIDSLLNFDLEWCNMDYVPWQEHNNHSSVINLYYQNMKLVTRLVSEWMISLELTGLLHLVCTNILQLIFSVWMHVTIVLQSMGHWAPFMYIHLLVISTFNLPSFWMNLLKECICGFCSFLNWSLSVYH